MLARVAEALYWMGRYLERSENVTRILVATEEKSTEIQALNEDLAQAAWKDLELIFPGAVVRTFPGAVAPSLGAPYVYSFFLYDSNPYSVTFSLRRARENARTVREALTMEVFLNLNETYRELEGHGQRATVDPPSLRSGLAATLKGILGTVGAIEHTMTRDEGWLFLKLGESLERLYRSAAILRVKLPSLLAPSRKVDIELTYTRWRTLLRSLSSLENYRHAFGARLEPDDVVRFALFNKVAPRSLRYGAFAVKGYLEQIGGNPGPDPATNIVGKLHSMLSYEEDEILRRAEFGSFLDHLLRELDRAHETIGRQYFVT